MQWLLAISVLAAIGLPVLVLRTDRWSITPFFMVTAALSAATLGFVVLDSRTGRSVSAFHALGVAVLVAGYILRRRKSFSASPLNVEPATVKALYLFWAVVVGLVLYHFVVGGVPLFSPAIETERFDFSSSGLFGIPGRMLLYGLPFLVFLVTAVRFRGTGRPVRGLWILTLVVFATAQLLSGFKAAVLNVVFIAVLAGAVGGRPLRLTRSMIVPAILLGVVGLAFFVFLSFRLPGTGVSGLSDAFIYVFERPTVVQAEPAYFALTELEDTDRPYLVTDSIYFVNKYLGLGEAGSAYPLDWVVSANLTHTPLDGKHFIVPVTVGPLAGLEVDFGPIVALLGMLVLGWAFAYGLDRALVSTRPFAVSSWAFAVYMVGFYIGRGGLPYVVINSAAVLAFLFALWFVSLEGARIVALRRSSIGETGP